MKAFLRLACPGSVSVVTQMFAAGLLMDNRSRRDAGMVSVNNDFFRSRGLEGYSVRFSCRALTAHTLSTFAICIFRWLTTTTCFLLAAAIALLGVSVFLSVSTGDWHWLQRSGALVVSIGAILSTRKLLRTGTTEILTRWNGAYVLARGSDDPAEERRDLIAAYWGFWLVGFGTLIWAYGDLLAYLFQQGLLCSSVWLF